MFRMPPPSPPRRPSRLFFFNPTAEIRGENLNETKEKDYKKKGRGKKVAHVYFKRNRGRERERRKKQQNTASRTYTIFLTSAIDRWKKIEMSDRKRK